MYKLVIADDEGSKSTVPVIRDEITIGRKEGNTIRLTERNVSRRHARVLRENGRVYIEEIAARYGIKKNGVKIDQRAEFAPGDVVSIGDYQLTLKAKKEKKAPEAPPRAEQSKPTQKKKQDEGTQVLPAMPAKLVVVSSNFAGQEFPLNRKEMIIGRAEDCDIIIDHRSVSQKHAKVIRESGNEYQIVDLNSKNGVTVGAEQYRAVHIKRGDVIELGHVKFRFVEPGENYVFTPQPELDDVDLSAGSSNNGMMIGAVVVVALLAAGAIFMFMGGDNTTTTPDTDSVAQAEATEPSGSEPTPPAVAGEGAPDDAAEADSVSKAIAEARENIAAGELDKAIGALESARKYLDPSPEQNDTIAELMGSAKTEKPFKRDYEAAKDDVKSGDFRDALERLSEIPKHSVFHKIYREHGLRTEAIDGLLLQAEDALAKDDRKEARSLAEEALSYDSDHEGANTLLERLEDEDVKLAMKKKADAKARSGSSSSRSKSGSSGSSKKRKPAKKKPSVSREEAKALYSSAQKKIFANDPSGAIADCKKALSAGQTSCYRILAIAHKQTGNSGQACSNFKRYLGTGPNNASAVEREMEKLGCN